MDFRTELHTRPSENKLLMSDKVLTIGSCFADEMAFRLAENKIQIGNYFGTVFNPVSIHRLLMFGLKKETPSAKTYSVHDGVHFNFYFHSSFSSTDKNELANRIQNTIAKANSFLRTASRIIITYGTSFVYKLTDTGEAVANCHKMPSTDFNKYLLTQPEIIESFEGFYGTLKSINPACKIILTVSPVRHLKDTIELNAVSKSILRIACHSISNQFSDVEYFPAYEILLDDLRDYRFYKKDLIHPTEEAIDYICEKFIDSYFDQSAKIFFTEWSQIKKDLNHKPFNIKSESHQKFLQSLLLKLEKLQSQVDVSKEIENLKSSVVIHQL